MKKLLGSVVLFCSLFSPIASAELVGDLVTIDGIRDNQLTGYGLVVGLDGTGDKATFTQSTLKVYLENNGIKLPPGIAVKSKNVAAVIVTADLPSFASVGQTLDVTVSSIGDAKSLRGGMLVMTPLKGVDNQIYAIAQGSMVVGGLDASGKDGSKITINTSSVGRISSGATVEVPFEGRLVTDGHLTLRLKNPSFELAKRINNAINGDVGYKVASTANHSKILVEMPLSKGDAVSFISRIQAVNVDTPDDPAKVIVNSRTGTVIITSSVKVSPVAIAHGGITLEVEEAPAAGVLTGAKTEDSKVTISERGSRLFNVEGGANLRDIVNSFNDMGLAPSDLVAILQALKSSGSLHADLEII